MLFMVATSLTDPAAARPHAAEELARLRVLREAGAVRSFLLRTDGGGAFLVLEASDPAQAEAHLATLPLVGAGLMTYELLPVTEPPF